jgi:hypothetical protein
MTDAEWLRGIADSGWFDDKRDEKVMALLRRAADGLEELGGLKAELVAAKDWIDSGYALLNSAKAEIARLRDRVEELQLTIESYEESFVTKRPREAP